MPNLAAALVLALAAALCSACDVADTSTAAPSLARASSATTSGPSGASSVSAPATAAPAATASAAATPARIVPPPPPPPVPEPSIKAVPARGVRGTTFVFQFAGFPTSDRGVDIIQTVTLPTGAKLPPKAFLASPNGTGFTTYTPDASDPSGQYVVTLQVAGGGVSSFVVIIVD